jgi:N-acetyl-beta-hexosaminidase
MTVQWLMSAGARAVPAHRRTAYGWDPGTHLSGVPAPAVLGVEAPLWTETLVTPEHIEFMALPRLPVIAELGIGFYRSPQVRWARGRS